MKRKRRRQETDQELLEALFSAEHEWKQIRAIMNQSIEPIEEGMFRLKLAQTKYLFLFQEAKRRDVRGIQLH